MILLTAQEVFDLCRRSDGRLDRDVLLAAFPLIRKMDRSNQIEQKLCHFGLDIGFYLGIPRGGYRHSAVFEIITLSVQLGGKSMRIKLHESDRYHPSPVNPQPWSEGRFPGMTCLQQTDVEGTSQAHDAACVVRNHPRRWIGSPGYAQRRPSHPGPGLWTLYTPVSGLSHAVQVSTFPASIAV